MLPLNYANICTALLLEILLMYGLCKTLKWDFIQRDVGCSVSKEEYKNELT